MMGIELAEGSIIALDAHTDSLLYAYTAAHNEWVMATWASTMRDSPYTADPITAEEMGRQNIAEFLHQWARERRNMQKFSR